VPVFIGTRDPIINIKDTIIVDLREPVQEEEGAPMETKDANSLGPLGPLGNDKVNSIGSNIPKEPQSEAPRTNNSAHIAIKRQYHIVASTDFNQGATGTRTSPRLIDKKGGASVISKAPNQNSQNSN
jgi:hypothetical protein